MILKSRSTIFNNYVYLESRRLNTGILVSANNNVILVQSGYLDIKNVLIV